MIRDKCEEDLSAKLIPHTSWECVDSASWTSYRKRLNSYTPDHPWNALGDKELLEKLGGYTRETSDSQEGLTLAGLLMFGTDDAIRKFFRTHQLNYYEYDGREETDPDRRWIDRIYPDGTWSGNLYQFFFRILPRLTESIKKPFRLNHDLTAQGETTAHKAIREALANTIVHADYRGEGGLIIKKYPDRLVLTNPGTLLLSKERIFRGGISKCRNISLQTMFQRIGIVEKAGSGIDVILRGWMEQCLMPPEVLETTDPPQVTWTLPFIGIIPQSSAEKLEQLIGSEQYQTLTLAERMILLIAFEKNAISHADIHELLPMLHPSDLTKILQVLVDRGYLLSEGRTRAKKYKLASPTNTRNNSQMSQLSGEMSQLSSEMSQLSSEMSQLSSEMSQLPESACLVRKKLKCKQEELEKAILDLCRNTWTDSYQLAKFLEREKRTLQRILKTMVLHGLLDARFPQHPSHPQQAYRTRQTLTEHS